ncbi:calcium-binding EGF-like domain-containing protein pawn [Leptinotarsa decemlineata]|uniref:calcium-binding EGF-like domain-containing protein pawn n=1 Tax=Leptinotarsa decemlineata TaxID=7539 RepID=UPI003D309E86
MAFFDLMWTLTLCLLVFSNTLQALDDPYSNSFISPNSAEIPFDDDVESGDKTSGPNEILQPSLQETTARFDESIETSSSVVANRVQRSADPILSKTAATDDLLIFKNIEEALDSNDVELSGRLGHFIQPSKTDQYISNDAHQTSDDHSGEGHGAPHQARSLPLQESQEITPSATMTTTNFASQFPPLDRGRQANPDIQDIITGLVKLLNGNVNVQANTGPGLGRPLRPLSTRINNRGPPRITDLPALPPDFDVPAPLPPPPLGQMPPPLTPTRMPTPYPFDVPVPNMSPIRPFTGPGTSIPISDHSNKRPGFYRPPTLPPWKRRRPPNRRPPPYKTMPSYSSDMISLTSEKPMDDILTLDMGTHLSATGEEGAGMEEGSLGDQVGERNSTEVVDTTTDAVADTSEIDKEISDFEKNKEKVSKLDKYTSKTTIVTPTFNTEAKTEDPAITKESNPSLSEETELPVTSTHEAESTSSTTTSSPVEENSAQSATGTFSSGFSSNILNTSFVNTTSTDSSSGIPLLESSIQEVVQTMKEDLLGESTSLASTETEKLPEMSSTSESGRISTLGGVSSQSSSTATSSSHDASTTSSFPYYQYRPRPGIVLDDTEYKPGGIHRQPIVTRPVIGQIGDIFDITVSAIQGPGSSAGQGKPYVIPVDIEQVHMDTKPDVITSSIGDEGFVSIDGKRTYLNLFGDATPSTSLGAMIEPTTAKNQVSGTAYSVVENEKIKKHASIKPTVRRPLYGRPRPSQPPVRIDTCIVGDDTTCDSSQHEICKTELGVSACHCRPGTARRKHRDPCRKIVSILLSLRVDKLYDRKVVWANELGDQNSDSYLQLSYEAERALESAMSMTPFSDEFLAAKVNGIYRGDRSQGQAGVFVNLTLQMDENADTSRPTVRGDIQRHLLGVIQRRSNNVGESALWVDSPPGSVSNLQDLDECSSPDLHDCHSLATCVNVFGSFRCECATGFRDPWADNKHRAGRHCEQCSPQHCNNRGECRYQNGQEVCVCSGNYYGTQCELDGEVLGVAIGASIAAIIIIGLTLVCLVMWSRRWSREHKAAVGSPVFGYMATASNTVKTPVVGAPPYQLTLEDRLRWAQIADVMAQANHYAPEPGHPAPTRPSSAMFGYPSLPMGTLQHHHHGHGTLPPVPMPRLNLQAQLAGRAASIHGMRPFDNSSSSEEEDKADLLGRNFQVPRPKSRSNASIANQSGIYYDVDYEQNEAYKQAGGIPLSTYNVGRQPFFRN